MSKIKIPSFMSSSKFQIIVLIVIGIIPVVAARYFTPTHFVSNGELVQPARPIENVELQGMDGQAVEFSSLKSKWTMIYIGNSACDKECWQNLYKMRQVRLSQGKHMRRIQYAWLLLDQAVDIAALKVRLQEHPKLQVFRGDVAAIKALSRQFVLKQGAPEDGLNRIYLIDPLGNLMMSYPADADPTGIRKDFERLLRVSQIG
ncbi:MAG: hypothetical protein GXP09_11650 [Gammaproteobacteria bacterium]|nr:hypothetical protein [Gammaproteobacteria bacterium]